MPRKSQRIHIPFIHPHREAACTLGNVQDKQQSVFFRDFSCRCCILQGSGYIGAVIQHNGLVPADRGGFHQLFRIDKALPVAGNQKGFSGDIPQIIQRTEHTVVLRHRCNDLICRNAESAENSVQPFRGTGCEKDPVGLPDTQQFPELFSAFRKRIFCVAGKGASELTLRRIFRCPAKCLQDTLRLRPGCGRMIQIDHYSSPWLRFETILLSE